MQATRERWVFQAKTATRGEIRLRMGLCGAGGSGKSYSALAIASALARRLGTGPLYVIDSENESALRYAYSSRSGRGFSFEHVPMPYFDYSPASYMAALDYCEGQGAGMILVDSISHEYDGPGGIMEIVDQNTNGRDSFSGWKVATPLHKRFLQRLNTVGAHLIYTIRAKTAYEMRDDPKRPGKQSFQKVGLGPVQREGIEYEGDIFGWMTDAVLTIDKTRCDRIEPGSIWQYPGDAFAGHLADWILDTGDSPLDMAIAETTRRAIEAAQAKNADAYKAATGYLTAQCKRLGLDKAAHDAAQAKVRAAVESTSAGVAS